MSRKLPVMLQTEASECGLVCLAMVAGYYGDGTDLFTLRSRFSVSLKGATLVQIIANARALELDGRAVRCELRELRDLHLPAILHWDFAHFVVLADIRRSHA